MAYTKGSKVTAANINDMKARVKAEMSRRKYTGSLASYAGSSYDYSTTPALGVDVKVEHANKIITPMNAVKATGYSTRSKGNKIASFANLEALLSQYEARSLTANNSDCKTACSGLCHTACSGACRSGCSTGCSTTCKSGCSTTCTTNCASNCSNDCTGTCDDTCSQGCFGGCANTCNDTCDGGCDAGCYGTCSGSCSIACAPTCATGAGWA